MRFIYSSAFRFFDLIGGYFTLRYLPFFQKIECDRIRAKRFQRGMLRRLLKHAYDYNPHYHDVLGKLNLNPHYDDPYVLLSKLPILTKEVVRQHRFRLVSKYPSKYKVAFTSGSSGVPLRILRDYPADGLGQASYYEGLSWYGYDIGEPFIQLWGRKPVFSPKQYVVQMKNRLTNFFELNAHFMTDANIGEYVKKIQKIKPRLLYGYVSSLELLCKYMKEHGLNSYIPTVVTTAEKLFDYQRNIISSTLGSEVYDQYGASEVTSVAFECPAHTCLHVIPRVLVDIVDDDGEKCASGETGRIILTDLANLKMPFLKYEVGDLGTAVEKTDPCTCGRQLPSIKNIEGRTGDMIIGLNGNRVYSEFFAHLFQSSGFAEAFGLRQFQIIQKTGNMLIIRLNIEFSPTDETLDYLNLMIKKYLGPIETRYEFLSEIPSHPTGKRSSVISEI